MLRYTGLWRTDGFGATAAFRPNQRIDATTPDFKGGVQADRPHHSLSRQTSSRDGHSSLLVMVLPDVDQVLEVVVIVFRNPSLCRISESHRDLATSRRLPRA